MSFRNGLKALLAAVLFAGCASQAAPEKQEVKVLVPTGAPALGMLMGTLDNADVTLEYTSGTDLLSAELAKKDGDYDVIVAPVNLGLKTYEANPVYQCAGVLTWGNLYMVGKDEEALHDPAAEVAAFGEGAIPGMVFNTVEADEISGNVSWYPSVAEAQQALLSGKADAALLAEPAVSAALAKDDSLKVISDLQALWKDKEGSERTGYPQAALFVKESVGDDFLTALQEALEAVDIKKQSEEMVQEIENADPEKLGVPSAQIAVKSWPGQNIHFVPASEAKADVETFLKKMNMTIPEGGFRD